MIAIFSVCEGWTGKEMEDHIILIVYEECRQSFAGSPQAPASPPPYMS